MESQSKFSTAGRQIVGGVAATKKTAVLEDKRARLYAALQNVYKENQNAAELVPGKKKVENDIIKRNMMAASQRKPGSSTGPKRPPLGKRPSGLEASNTNQASQNYFGSKANIAATAKPTRSMSHSSKPPTAEEGPRVKKKNPREIIYEELKAYHEKPTQKKLKELKEKCQDMHINFDTISSKAKQDQMKEKQEMKDKKKAEKLAEQKAAKEEELKLQKEAKMEEEEKKATSPPIDMSVLEASMSQYMSALEDLLAYYTEQPKYRSQKINETDPKTGRSPLHYLCYLANSEMVQTLGAFDELKMNVLDGRDRTCMHYAAIKGNSDIITTLVLLFKTNGGMFYRAQSDPAKKEQLQDEQFKTMCRCMDKSDFVHVDDEPFAPIERLPQSGHPQVSMNSLVDFRDHKGRTALHVAVIWNNKDAVECLLKFDANPNIEDGAGYRPLDYTEPSTPIAELLMNKMYSAPAPNLKPWFEKIPQYPKK